MIERLMKTIRKKTKIGRLTITLPENGSAFFAHAYPSAEHARSLVLGELRQLRGDQVWPVSAEIEKKMDQPLAHGKGTTALEALNDLACRLEEERP